ncbi:MAG: TIGR01841 family phasin [Acidiferrobacterales bacterium]
MQPEIQQVVDVINKANTEALRAAKDVAAINTRAVDKLAEYQLGLVELALTGGVKQLELLRDAKDYKDYFAAQAELAQEAAHKVLATARETVGVITGVRDELNAVVEKGVETASTSVKAAAKKGAETASASVKAATKQFA